MKYLLILILLFSFQRTVLCQSFTDSNLPIVIITTDINPYTGTYSDIYDEPKTKANLKIIYHPDGSRNYIDDANTSDYLNYSGRIGIEIRGSSTQTLDKKSYGFTTLQNDDYTNNNVSILGMPPENDWILYSMSFDPSMMRSFLSYELSRSIGEYAPRCQYCEVVINGNYKGLYVFMEKIKADVGRVNVHKITTLDNSGRDLTGGYITKADKTTGGDPVAWTMLSYSGSTDFIHAFPDASMITPQQNTYIKYQFNNLQNVMSSQNASIRDGYPTIIDIPSFVDYMIMCELSSNADSYQFSTYFHKDKLGKLRAGPIWDFDLTYGNDIFSWGFDRSHTNVWQFDNGDNTGPRFWRDLYNNSIFRCYMGKRWKELTASEAPLNYDEISERIDRIESHISEALVRENYRWWTVSNHVQQIKDMKTWLRSRIDWITGNLPNGSGCSNVAVPPLVITKINYNPVATQDLTSENQEFLEISNNGFDPVNLTGIYFSGLGISYCFPPNTSLTGLDRLYLAGDAATFKQLYGMDPFGQFARNLSNESEKIVLADAFGNVIDSVRYGSLDPWPADANGKGFYLQLTDVNADNSEASNWILSNYVALGVETSETNAGVHVFPNPAAKYITIVSEKENILALEITDMGGRKVMEEPDVNSGHTLINVENFMPGIYLLSIRCEHGQTLIRKFVKNR